jgi:hypothetical protein
MDQQRIQMLIQQLRAGGDERYGGSRPLGGKATAGTVDYSRSGGDTNVRALGPGYPMNLSPAEAQAYDAWMNMKESELQDAMGKQFGDAYGLARRIPRYTR